MNKINIDIMNEALYVRTLKNGFTIYMFPDDRIHKYYVTLTTKYGAIHDEFIPKGHTEMMKFPTGIAHFLEHQMFENKDGRDLDLLFEANGAKVNAFTSHECTSYLFGATDHVKENVGLLLERVYSLNSTDETVAKEKGIIIQELKMYKDNPSSALFETIAESIFVNDNRRINVGGTIEDVERTTRDELELCYNTFYQPHNMYMVVTGNFDRDEIIEVVETYMANNKFDEKKEIVTKKIVEPKEVASKYHEVKMKQAETPKLAFSVKILVPEIIKKYGMRKTIIASSILFKKLFGPISILNEELVKNNIIDTDFSNGIHIADDYFIRYITCETKQKDLVISKINEALQNRGISDEDFDLHKKMYVSSSIRLFSNIESLNESILEGEIEGNRLSSDFVTARKNFTKEEYDNIVNEFDLSNISVTYLTKE